MPPRNYEGTRARCQRIRDAKLFSGWVGEITDGYIAMTCDHVPEFEPLDQIAIEVYGHAQNLLMVGVFESVAGKQAQFRVVSSTRVIPAKENVRIHAGRLGVLCEFVGPEGNLLEYRVVDVSKGGVGLEGSMGLPKGHVGEIRFDTEAGDVTATAEVRYCKLDEASREYRLGLRIEFSERVSRGRWLQLFSQVAA